MNGPVAWAMADVALHGGWFHRTIVETGRLPLFCFFAAVVAGFAFIRVSVRLIRAKVRWWPGNVTPGDLHIHHVVFGVVFMLIGGVAQLAVTERLPVAQAVSAVIFGVGAALVLDEFSLILHLRDVYWSEQGRTSVDAVFVAIAVTALLLLGLRPIGFEGTASFFALPNAVGGAPLAVLISLVNLGLAVVTVLKGKIWTGLFGLFVPVLLVFGAVRLARPGAPWARWHYLPGSRRMTRSERRERRVRQPLIKVKIRVQEFISGRHDLPLR